jgi:adenine deaminase
MTVTAAPLTIDAHPTAFLGAPAAPSPEELRRLKAVARGDEAGDVALRGGRVVMVHTCEVIAADVILAGRHIAAVVPPQRLQAERDVDVTDRFVAPTFADAHIHMDYTLLTPSELARMVVPLGTNVMFADPVCIANVLGVMGMDLAAATAAPMRIFQQVTPDVPRRGRQQLGGAQVPHDHICDRITWPNSTSIGESSPFLDDHEARELASIALLHGRKATGHTARLAEEPLWAYIAGGASDDHNAATWEEVLDRVRLGMAITIQSGSMTDYCEAILGDPERLGMVAQHLCFCADDKHVEDLLAEGHIDHHVRSAVALGVEPALAICMASLNAAMHYRVDHLVGSLTPGRVADLQVLGDLENFRPTEVWVEGAKVAQDGVALFVVDEPAPAEALGTMNVGRFDPANLAVPAPSGVDTVLVRAMEMYDGYYKRVLVAEAAVVEFAQRASADGTIYSEVIINPTHWAGLGLADLCAGVAAGFDRAVADGLTECNILLSILRQQPAEEAEALAAFMTERRPHRVVGLSIDGNESAAGRTGPRFARAYAMAGEAGFGLTAHAGESSGADGVRDALDLLGVQRIDHGVRAVEDDDVVRRLVESNTTLNVCVSSNCRRMYPDIGAHPIVPLLEAGVPVTLNTDDPAPLFNSLTEEFVLVAGHFDWSLGDAAAITRTAIDASFCSDATKAALTARLDEALTALSYPTPHVPGSQPTTVT